MAPVARRAIAALALAVLTLAVPARAQTPPAAAITEGDYVLPSYRFRSGESLANVRLHYRTIGTPRRDALVGAGLALDPAKYFLIFPDILYRFEASFDYDPAKEVAAITAPLLAILFADDELNPVELGAIEPLIAQVPRGRHVVIPTGPATEAHRTQVKASVWAAHLGRFLDSLPALPPLTPGTFVPGH